MNVKHTKSLAGYALAAMLASTAFTGVQAQEETIKVGILHSLSGTMAISETTLKDAMLMLIEEQNKKGGLLGKKLEAVVVDPASDWPLFAEKARELIEVNGVSAVFGCWTSVSRKSVLPVFEELNSLLFYPVQYEGEESQRNVFYTGAAPNQQAIPAVDYLMNEEEPRHLGALLLQCENKQRDYNLACNIHVESIQGRNLDRIRAGYWMLLMKREDAYRIYQLLKPAKLSCEIAEFEWRRSDLVFFVATKSHPVMNQILLTLLSNHSSKHIIDWGRFLSRSHFPFHNQ